MLNPEVFVNGKRGGQLSSLDRGLLYGDGVFETIAVKQGKLQHWEDHLERLQLGCEILNLQGLDIPLLQKEVHLLLESENNLKNIIKIIITRGVGGRGYKPTVQTLTRIVQKFPWPKQPVHYIKKGVNVTQCKFRLSKQNKLAKIKHLNRLEQVLARSEWNDDYEEGLVSDADDNVIEATSNNVFFQSDEMLVTPDLFACGVAGVMRKKVIEYCYANGIEVDIRNFKQAEMKRVQAMFLCNSINGIWPVHSYCGRKLCKTPIINQLVAVFNS